MKNKKITVDVNKLKTILQSYHNNDCWNETKKWFNQFGNNMTERVKFLKYSMYTSKPITAVDSSSEIGEFSILQGDVIKTKAAITSSPLFSFDPLIYSYYLTIPSSCSVQPNRYKQVLLARLAPIENLENGMKNIFLQSIRFENGKTFYMPPINDETIGEFGFIATFEEISYIENTLLQSAQRIASLSLIGWRLLNAFLVNHFTRPSSDDIKLRQSTNEENWSFYE